jgi:hydrogenase-4 component F
MIPALILVPALAGLAALAIRAHPVRRALLAGAALAHAGLTAAAWVERPAPLFDGWLALDEPGLLFLSITSALFLAASVYGVGYLAREGGHHRRDFVEGYLFVNSPEAIFTGCLLFFLASMTLVTVSQHFGLLWVAVEATTLASAPLIYFHRHRRSLEATWKYLLICSVGIALALLGNFLLAAAAAKAGEGGQRVPLVLDRLLAGATNLRALPLEAAFLFLLVGYGTKMGLAPLHTWLPDAHSESPSLVSALLSGALLNCAFLAILRIFQVCGAAGAEEEAFARQLLISFGLLSMAVAAVFIIGQTDFKRMLAYSSVEHMGILSLGVGLGGLAATGAMFHAVNHSLTKAALFLLAGNILAAYRTKSVGQVSGVSRVLPVSAVLWTAGFLAITGTPPFSPFLSEFTILRSAIEQGQGWVAAGYLLLLALIFVGMATIVLRMVQGNPSPEAGQAEPKRESWWAVVPPGVLCSAVLLLGLYLPPALGEALTRAGERLDNPRAAAAGAPGPQAAPALVRRQAGARREGTDGD